MHRRSARTLRPHRVPRPAPRTGEAEAAPSRVGVRAGLRAGLRLLRCARPRKERLQVEPSPYTRRLHRAEEVVVIPNRSVPAATVIPELAYDDVAEASDWFCNAFGFPQRLRIGDHRSPVVFVVGAIIVIAPDRSDAGVV